MTLPDIAIEAGGLVAVLLLAVLIVTAGLIAACIYMVYTLPLNLLRVFTE